MELRSRLHRISLVLLILGNIATALSGQNLDCTNDFDETMSCQFDAQNCAEYNLTVWSHHNNEVKYCTPTQCDTGLCCCSLNPLIVNGESHTATVWKGGKSMESRNISIRDSIKPRRPNITSVNESNGNFQILWITNYQGSFSEELTAEVMYHKKGDTEKQVTNLFKPSTSEGQNYYEIPGERLEPSTTYAVSVRSYTNRSGMFSDSSDEWEFTTHTKQ